MNQLRKDVFQLFNLNVKEVSLVDTPAVPGAKFVVVKSAAELEEAVSVLDRLDAAVKKEAPDAQEVAQAARAVRQACAAITGQVEKLLTESEKDWFISDVHWAIGLLMSVKSVFKWLDDRLEEEDEDSEAVKQIAADTRSLIRQSASVLSDLVEEVEESDDVDIDKASDTPDTEDEDMAEPTETTEETDESADTAVADRLDTIVAALGDLKDQVGAQSDRLTIIESRTSEGEEPDEEADGESADEELTEFEAFDPEDLAYLQEHLDDLEPEQRAEIEDALNAQEALTEMVLGEEEAQVPAGEDEPATETGG